MSSRSTEGTVREATGYGLGRRACGRVGSALNTVGLLLRLKGSSLPRLSERIGSRVRTNSEALIGVTVPDRETVFSDGIAIGCILSTDEHSHLEVVRYPAGSGFWRLLAAPATSSPNLVARIGGVVSDLVVHPLHNLKVSFVDDWAKRTQILLFMQTIDSELGLTLGRLRLRTDVTTGRKPSAYIPEAKALADRYAEIVGGKPETLLTETLLGIPTTAHILGGCPMGASGDEGVIDADNRVWGYRNMYVCDGSALSANPGVNPSLTITALAERAMSKVAPA